MLNIIESTRSRKFREERSILLVLQINLSFQLLLSTLNVLNIVVSCWRLRSKRRTWLAQEAHHLVGEQKKKQIALIYGKQSHDSRIMRYGKIMMEEIQMN